MGSLPSGWVSFRPPARSAWLRAACGPAGAEGNPFPGTPAKETFAPRSLLLAAHSLEQAAEEKRPHTLEPWPEEAAQSPGQGKGPNMPFPRPRSPWGEPFFFFFLIRFKCRSRVCSCYTRAQRSPILPLSPFLYPPPVLLAAPRGRCRFVPGPLPTEARAPGWASGSRAWAPPCKAGNQPFPGLTP